VLILMLRGSWIQAFMGSSNIPFCL
jgi:hypothetical protein